MVAEDYAWAVETHALGLDFCLTFVRGLGPDEVISRLGGADPVSMASAEALGAAMDAVDTRVDEQGATRPSGLDYVAATPAGDWTMVIEPNGFLCAGDDAVRTLSAAGAMVSFYFNENTTPRFVWAVGGREVVAFDPGCPAERYGADPGRLDPVLAELGFGLDPDRTDYDQQFRERTFALMERITGVRWDAAFLAAATFRCAGVGGIGSHVTAQPWYAEVRAELAAYAEDPDDWAGDDLDGWGRRGVTDRKVKALGAAGTSLYDQDRDLALAIAHAPAELIARMTVWAKDRPFRRAGIVEEPWFAPIRDRMQRDEWAPEPDVRLVRDRLQAHLGTVLPPYHNDEAAQLNAVRSALWPHEQKHATDRLCWHFVSALGMGGGTAAELHADLWRDFPELRDVAVPPPAPPAPPAERPAQRRKREARERQEEEWRRADLTRTWGGRVPADPRLLDEEVAQHARGLVDHDRDLIDRIAEAGPAAQREMAVWAARYWCARAGLITQDWVEAELTALDRGDPPTPPFTDFHTAFARWRDVPPESVTSSATISFGPAEPPRIEPAVIALHEVIAARHEDPLVAAMDTIHNAVVLDPGATIAAFRAAFDLGRAPDG
ncbi:DUF6461 domain-containing protein [Actinoplanes sp. CA-030573]|uniref:DUF6461 domain-containing protein n=1 Tax=Actinoplanes sp. CA-030573 TaxID=3239898 RepID=UPI003D8A8B61